MDASLNPDPSEMEPDEDDLQVPIDTLAIDGTRPEVGDQVSLKVGGQITKIVNDTAFVEPQTVNGQPIPEEDESDGMDMLEKQSHAAGAIGSSGMM